MKLERRNLDDARVPVARGVDGDLRDLARGEPHELRPRSDAHQIGADIEDIAGDTLEAEQLPERVIVGDVPALREEAVRLEPGVQAGRVPDVRKIVREGRAGADHGYRIHLVVEAARAPGVIVRAAGRAGARDRVEEEQLGVPLELEVGRVEIDRRGLREEPLVHLVTCGLGQRNARHSRERARERVERLALLLEELPESACPVDVRWQWVPGSTGEAPGLLEHIGGHGQRLDVHALEK